MQNSGTSQIQPLLLNSLKKEFNSHLRILENPANNKQISEWLEKAYKDSQSRLVACLVPTQTDTEWWHEWVMRSAEIRFIQGKNLCVAVFYPELENPYKLSIPVGKSIR